MQTPFNQYLVDYTVRNITTGDEEEIRVLELTTEEIATFPADVRGEIANLLADVNAAREAGFAAHAEWDHAQSRIVELLLPYLSDRALYDSDYERWESNLLEFDADDES